MLCNFKSTCPYILSLNLHSLVKWILPSSIYRSENWSFQRLRKWPKVAVRSPLNEHRLSKCIGQYYSFHYTICWHLKVRGCQDYPWLHKLASLFIVGREGWAPWGMEGTSQKEGTRISSRTGLCWVVSGSSKETSGEGDGTPLQYSCLENPMDGGAW